MSSSAPPNISDLSPSLSRAPSNDVTRSTANQSVDVTHPADPNEDGQNVVTRIKGIKSFNSCSTPLRGDYDLVKGEPKPVHPISGATNGATVRPLPPLPQTTSSSPALAHISPVNERCEPIPTSLPTTPELNTSHLNNSSILESDLTWREGAYLDMTPVHCDNGEPDLHLLFIWKIFWKMFVYIFIVFFSVRFIKASHKFFIDRME